jgi:coatomer protein complex subunit gamma
LSPSGDDEGWKVIATVPLASLPYSQVGSTYLLLSLPEEGNITGSFSAVLKFQVRDVDPTTGEPESDEFYDDTYAVCLFYFTLH